MSEEKYYEIEALKNIYLEDSYVLEIVEEHNLLSFKVEIVLNEKHSLYLESKKNEMYCYRLGYIDFINPMDINWKFRNFNLISVDARGENDLGNIDIFYRKDGIYYLEGDWGMISLKCDKVEVRFPVQYK